MLVAFFVLCLVIRLMRDMVLVRPVVGDVLSQMIIMEGVKHDMIENESTTHCVRYTTLVWIGNHMFVVVFRRPAGRCAMQLRHPFCSFITRSWAAALCSYGTQLWSYVCLVPGHPDLE